MPLYKEQGVVLRSVKLGEADKIVTILTQSSGKVRGVAKGIRRTQSKFGARLEPLTHVSLMLYRGRGALDTVTQAEIISPFRRVRDDFETIAAAETMVEAVDRVAEEHERNVPLFMLLVKGLRALETGPRDGAAVAESFVLKMLSLSGFHPSLSACAACASPGPLHWFSAAQGGVLCPSCADRDAGPVSEPAVRWLDDLARIDLVAAGELTPDREIRREARSLLYGFAEFHLDRRIRSFSLLARQPAPALTP